MKKIKVAIVGALGYVGQEIISNIKYHPNIEIVCLTSRSPKNKTLSQIYPQHDDIKIKISDTTIQSIITKNPDVAFLALPHGESLKFAETLHKKNITIFDLSADLRLNDPNDYQSFYQFTNKSPLLKKAIYALPEINKTKITNKNSNIFACPGCYPTSVLIPIIPIIPHIKNITKNIAIASQSGTSGAGKNPKTELLFAECNENLRAYGLPLHRHIAEIEQEINQKLDEKKQKICFIPHLVPTTKGMVSTTFIKIKKSTNLKSLQKKIHLTYKEFSKKNHFVRYLPDSIPNSKRTLNTNFIEISYHIDPRSYQLILFSAIDNLCKGAATQAIQAFNIKFNFPENTALR